MGIKGKTELSWQGEEDGKKKLKGEQKDGRTWETNLTGERKIEKSVDRNWQGERSTREE